jgi:signal transduction histidine kinase
MISTDPQGPRRSLVRGVLVFRWIALVWMIAITATSSQAIRYPAVAWTAIGFAGAWTFRLTVDAGEEAGPPTLGMDLAFSIVLLLLSAVAAERGAVQNGQALFASAYPVAAVLSWGVEWGPAAGAAAGAALGLATVFVRPLDGVALDSLQRNELQTLATGIFLYMVSGMSVGLVSRLLTRSGEEVRAATATAIRERERAARLAERESMARQIHDSVLQALAMVHKRGREIASGRRFDRDGIAGLADLAADQEASLRAMIMREPFEVPTGAVSLRDELERAARATGGVHVAVSTVGSLLLERAAAEELAAAVRQLLQNVANHAGTDRATVFAEIDDGTLGITVRDDGMGFAFDTASLRERGKAGLVKSVIGRVGDLGGTVRVKTAPGEGTLVEIQVPLLPASGGGR